MLSNILPDVVPDDVGVNISQIVPTTEAHVAGVAGPSGAEEHDGTRTVDRDVHDT